MSAREDAKDAKRMLMALLINFGAATFKEGCKRVVNNHQSFASSRLRVNQNLTRSHEGHEEGEES